MSSRAFSVASLILFFLVASVPASAQIEVMGLVPGPRGLKGLVLDAGSYEPIANPTVFLRDSLGTIVVMTTGDDEGNFALQPPAPGTLELEINRIGYSPIEAVVEIPESGILSLLVMVSFEPIPLDEVEASVRKRPRRSEMTLAGFEARRVDGPGHYFDEEEIEERHPTQITDLLTRIPGMSQLRIRGRIVDMKVLRAQGGSFQRAMTPCFADLWLDGIRVREGGYLSAASTVPWMNDIISPENIGGIEVYSGPSQTPIQFNSSSGMCGVIVIWSRRGLGSTDGVLCAY